MTLFKIAHLTGSGNPDLDATVGRTAPGQASWATTNLQRCASCAFWGVPGERYSTQLGDRPCEKYHRLMRGRVGKPVPSHAFACRFFEPKNSVPTKGSDPPPDGLGQS
jgi:hypothetical protein